MKALALEFATDITVKRAYLSRVLACDDALPSVALCLRLERPTDTGLVDRVAELFQRMFNRDTYLEIIFLSDQQEQELARVCRPFYNAASLDE